MFNNFFFSENRAIYDMAWKKYCRAGQATVDNMAHAHCVRDTEGYRHTHSQYVIFIAFPLHQWLHERAGMLRYTYIVCLVCTGMYRLAQSGLVD